MALAGALPDPILFANRGADAAKNIKAAGGWCVLSASCHNTNASLRYFQLHDTATVPAGGAVPAVEFPVAPGTAIVIGTDFFTALGLPFAEGIAFAFSTTRGTYTAGAASDQSTQVVYGRTP